MVVFTGICALVLLLCAAIAVVTMFVVMVSASAKSFRTNEIAEGLFALFVAVAIAAAVGCLTGGVVLQLRKDSATSAVEEKP